MLLRGLCELRMCVAAGCVMASDVCVGLVLRVVFWGLPGFWKGSGLFV